MSTIATILASAVVLVAGIVHVRSQPPLFKVEATLRGFVLGALAMIVIWTMWAAWQ